MRGAHTTLCVITNARFLLVGTTETVSDNKSEHTVDDIFILRDVSKIAVVKVSCLNAEPLESSIAHRYLFLNTAFASFH